MRIPLGVSMESRDGARLKDAQVLNAVVENRGDSTVVRKRPGVADQGLVHAATAQLLYYWNGLKAVLGDTIYSGSVTTIVSGPTSSALTTPNANLQFSAQETNSDAATPRLFFKNRAGAWVINRTGTVTAVSLPAGLGSSTYTLLSLTRTGGTATATLAEDVFNVGDSVTIAGATPVAYNGAQTVTAITLGRPQTDVQVTITRSGTTATATTFASVPHNMTTGNYTISGATQSQYNGVKAVTVTGSTSFTFVVTVTPESPVSPATGSPIVATWLDGSMRVITGIGGSTTYSVDTPSGNTFSDGNSVTLSGSGGALGNGLVAGTYTVFNRTAAGFQFTGPACTAPPAIDVICGSGYTATRPSAPAISSITHPAADATATVTFATAHNFFYLDRITISGATQTDYNVSTSITSTSSTTITITINLQAEAPITPATGSPVVTVPAVSPTFSFTIGGSPATPATGTITAQSNRGMVPGVSYVNGYFGIMDTNGVVYTSDSDDPTTWGALSLITAQYQNGQGMAITSSQNYMIALKEYSTEYFYDAQNTTGSPFSDVANGFTQVGCASGDSVASVAGKIVFVSQSRNSNSKSVHMMLGMQQEKISTPDIDRIITLDSLATVYAYGLTIDGHDLYVLTLVNTNITLVYDLASKHWGRWLSYTIGASVSVSSITRSGTTATVVTATAHGLLDGSPVKLSGANQSEYNGVFPIRYISTTSYSIEVTGSPTSPATGTILSFPYSASYFKFTKAATYAGVTYLLHETDGHLYQMASSRYDDAGLPINFYMLTTRMDGGTDARKKMPSIRVIGDTVSDVALIRWSDDDCATFSDYRVVDLSIPRPEVRRCGAFVHRNINLLHIGNKPVILEALEVEITQ